MMNMEEELIEHVEKFSILYDQSEQDYRNKNVRNEAWEKMGDSWKYQVIYIYLLIYCKDRSFDLFNQYFKYL